MVTSIKVDRRAFSGHAELLRQELAEVYVRKAIEWVNEKKITSEIRIDSIVRIFLRKAEEEFEHRLHEDFPHPSYESYIGSACFASGIYFDNFFFREKRFVNSLLALKA